MQADGVVTLALVEEYYYTDFNRALTIKTVEGYLYSIDVYKKLDEEPSDCKWAISVDEASLCYLSLDNDCTAVILGTSAGIELVNLRKRAKTKLEPMDVVEECLEAAKMRGLL